MKDFRKFIGIFALLLLAGIISCKHDTSVSDSNLQGKNYQTPLNGDGVELKIEDADLIQVDDNPQCNTAEWEFTVKKPGSYDVWLSSVTCDTMHMSYADNVVITAGDSRLTKKPVGDQIVTDDKSISEPWFRADSHMGSIYFSKPGEYMVQVISDKVEPHRSDLSGVSIDKHTLINSVILKPKVN